MSKVLEKLRRGFKPFLIGVLLCPLIAFGGLETATYISDLVVTNPTGSDNRSTADDHIRLIKSTLKTTFPNITGAVSVTHTELNTLSGSTSGSVSGSVTGCTTTPTPTIKYKISGKIAVISVANFSCTSNATTLTITGLPSALAGFTTGGEQTVCIKDNGSTECGTATMGVDAGPGLTFSRNGSTTGFTNSGTKGLVAPIDGYVTYTYILL